MSLQDDMLGPVPIYCVLTIDKLDIVVTGDSNGVIKVWSTITGALVETFSNHELAVNDLSCVYINNIHVLISCSEDMTIKLYDIEKLLLINTLNFSEEIIRITNIEHINNYDTHNQPNNNPDYIIIASTSLGKNYFFSLNNIIIINTNTINNFNSNNNTNTATSIQDEIHSIYFDNKIYELHPNLKKAKLNKDINMKSMNVFYSKNINCKILVNGFGDGLFCVWDLDKILKTVYTDKQNIFNVIQYLLFLEYPHNDVIQMVDFSKSNNKFFTGSVDGNLLIWTIKVDILNKFKEKKLSYKDYEYENNESFEYPFFIEGKIIEDNIDSDNINNKRIKPSVNVAVWTCYDNFVVAIISSQKKKDSAKKRNSSLFVYDVHKKQQLYKLNNENNLEIHDECYILEAHPEKENLVLTCCNANEVIIFDIYQKKIIFKYKIKNYFFADLDEPLLILEGKFLNRGDKFMVSTYLGSVSFFSIYSDKSYACTYMNQFFEYELGAFSNANITNNNINALNNSNMSNNNSALRIRTNRETRSNRNEEDNNLVSNISRNLFNSNSNNSNDFNHPKYITMLGNIYPYQQPYPKLKLSKIECVLRKQNYSERYIKEALFNNYEGYINSETDRIDECNKELCKFEEFFATHENNVNNNGQNLLNISQNRQEIIANNSNNINRRGRRRQTLNTNTDIPSNNLNNRSVNRNQSDNISEEINRIIKVVEDDEESVDDSKDNSSTYLNKSNQSIKKNSKTNLNNKIIISNEDSFSESSDEYNEEEEEEEESNGFNSELLLDDNDNNITNYRYISKRENRKPEKSNYIFTRCKAKKLEKIRDSFSESISSKYKVKHAVKHNKIKNRKKLKKYEDSEFSKSNKSCNYKFNNSSEKEINNSNIQINECKEKINYNNIDKIFEKSKELKHKCLFCNIISCELIGPFEYINKEYNLIDKNNPISEIISANNTNNLESSENINYNNNKIYYIHYKCLISNNDYIVKINDDINIDKTISNILLDKSLICYRCNNKNATLKCRNYSCNKHFHAYKCSSLSLNQDSLQCFDCLNSSTPFICNSLIFNIDYNEEYRNVLDFSNQMPKNKRLLDRKSFLNVNRSLFSFFPQLKGFYYFIPESYEEYLSFFHLKVKRELEYNNNLSDSYKSNNYSMYFWKHLKSNNKDENLEYRYIYSNNNNNSKLVDERNYIPVLCQIEHIEYLFSVDNCTEFGIYAKITIKLVNDYYKLDDYYKDNKRQSSRNIAIKNKSASKESDNNNNNLIDIIFFPDNQITDFLIDKELFEINKSIYYNYIKPSFSNENNFNTFNVTTRKSKSSQTINKNLINDKIYNSLDLSKDIFVRIDKEYYNAKIIKICPKEDSPFTESDYENIEVQIFYNTDRSLDSISKNNKLKAEKPLTDLVENIRVSFWELKFEKINSFDTDVGKTLLNMFLKSISKCINCDEYSAFIEEVSKKEYPLYDEIIPVPSYLKLIEKRLKNSYYLSKESLMFDLDLILTNCISFNGTDNYLTDLADKMIKAIKSNDLKKINEIQASYEDNISTNNNEYNIKRITRRKNNYVNSSIDVESSTKNNLIEQKLLKRKRHTELSNNLTLSTNNSIINKNLETLNNQKRLTRSKFRKN